MALINRNVPDNPEIKESADTKRKSEQVPLSANKRKEQILGSDRKNIKVTPHTFSKVKTLMLLQDKKQYELIDDIIDYYIEGNLSDREKRMLKNTIFPR